ncbi:MAG: bifunctional folylpolyglutamate synthase/dihydrofolate synthase [Solirubrobacteraceae bacterium]
MSATWNAADAERHLLGIELFGMRFGLERMRRLTSALERPQDRFASIHVVGSNGKSSTTRMIAALLEGHGVRTGSFLSPHLVSYAERIQIGERELAPAAFGAAAQRAAHAATLVERTLEPGDRVTQFELLAAAAYDEFAREEVEVAVIEAGLGGRWDATNVIPSRVAALTNVGLEHQRWLGPTITDIAREKLAVVRDGTTLVVGGLTPDAEREARATASARGARLVHAEPSPLDDAVRLLGAFQRDNFAVARSAAEALLGTLDPAVVRSAAETLRIPGRLEPVDDDPLTLQDAAHNTSGMRALCDSLGDIAAGRPVVAVVSVLDDKDAAGMLGTLLPYCASVVYCANANPRALPPGTLESLGRQVLGDRGGRGLETEIEFDPRRALARARERARELQGIVLAAGSIYLIADLRRPPRSGEVSAL